MTCHFDQREKSLKMLISRGIRRDFSQTALEMTWGIYFFGTPLFINSTIRHNGTGKIGQEQVGIA
jgi:hypothetical protein